jgi:hypothetical protein
MGSLTHVIDTESSTESSTGREAHDERNLVVRLGVELEDGSRSP